MLVLRVLCSSIVRPIGLSFCSSHFRSKLGIASGFSLIRPRSRLCCVYREMGQQSFQSKTIKQANFRLCNVSSYTTELLEIQADEPAFHVLFIPGNPGLVAFYKNFLEILYELLGGTVSLTTVGHISQTTKDWENGRLFSLQDQIDQKVDFIKQELRHNDVPIILIGHSIGAHISLETFKRIPEKVFYCIGLYPFLAINPQSRNQFVIEKISKCPIVCVALSSFVGLLGLIPVGALRFIVRQFLGKSWSNTAVEVGCSHLTKYHTMRNILYLAMTEFKKLSETPDWAFMRAKQQRIAFLFGIDDHWGPLQTFEEISRQVPQIALSIEREGHTHAFCCTEAGSSCVAHHVATLITDQISSRSSTSTN